MKRVKSMVAALAVAVLAVPAVAAAQQTNVSERTFLTFSSAVEMPGLTLPAGTYVFKLADTASRNVVQVWNEDEDKMLGQWLFVQSERLEVTDETVVMFEEGPETATPAIQYWYFPGEKIGKEFIYPEDQAMRIARRSGQDVRTEDGVVEGGGIAAVVDATQDAAAVTADVGEDVLDNTSGAIATAADVTADVGEDVVDNSTGAVAEVFTQNNEQEAAVRAGAEPRAVGTAGQAEAQSARASQLPATASPLALSGLIGLLSLAGALGVRAVRQ